jgi:hypothetical protein
VTCARLLPPRRDFYVEGLEMQARLLGMATTAWCSSPLAVRLLEPRELTVFADRAFGEIVAGSLASVSLARRAARG